MPLARYLTAKAPRSETAVRGRKFRSAGSEQGGDIREPESVSG